MADEENEKIVIEIDAPGQEAAEIKEEIVESVKGDIIESLEEIAEQEKLDEIQKEIETWEQTTSEKLTGLELMLARNSELLGELSETMRTMTEALTLLTPQPVYPPSSEADTLTDVNVSGALPEMLPEAETAEEKQGEPQGEQRKKREWI